MKINEMRCEYAQNPIGLDCAAPRFSWTLYSEERDAMQKKYRIEVTNAQGRLMWDSGIIESHHNNQISYDGEKLSSNTKYNWKLTVWDQNEDLCDDNAASFAMGIMRQEDWKATWIKGGDLLRKEYSISKAVKSSTAYICGLGYYELYINGKKVGDHVLDPACTDFEQKVLYVTYDVTDCLKDGKNAVGVMLGNGRYSPYETTIKKNWHPLKKYGASPVMIYQQYIEYEDGTTDLIVSDPSWKCSDGPITFNDIYDGEHYDARLEKEGWDNVGFDDESWNHAIPVQEKMGHLVSQGSVPPIRNVGPITPVSMTQPAPGVYLYDFGQNFAGWVKLKIHGHRGDTVQLHFAELKDNKTGMLNPGTNRNAEATDIYICKGSGEEVFEPHFTYHGFRYVELKGYPGTPALDTLEGCIVHTDVERIGSFSCSNDLINKIHSNYIWTQVSNFHGIPTDCCQRDERMGWVGDAQLSSEAAVYNFDMAAFYSKFEADIRESQLSSGSVAGVSPAYWSCYPADPTYSTACVDFPWVISGYYNDDRIIKESMECMKKWVDYLGSQEDENGIVSFGLFGDWCPPMHANPVDTPFEITSTWYYAYDALLVSQMAKRLGLEDISDQYYKVFQRVSDNFNDQFLKSDRYSASKYSDEELSEKIKSWLNVLPEEQRPAVRKRYATLYSASSQTANLLPLFLNIVPENSREEVLGTLIQDICVTRGDHINTGVVGLKFLLDVLVDNGYEDLAYTIMTQESYPSFGYQILKEDATTLWERWEFLASDKCFNSLSHPFAGSVDTYFYKYLAGIRLDRRFPGFQKVILRPVPSGDLTYASASMHTINGLVKIDWHKKMDEFICDIEIPANMKAEVSLPKCGWDDIRIFDNGTVVYDRERSEMGVDDGKYVIFNVGSGIYHFSIQKLNKATQNF